MKLNDIGYCLDDPLTIYQVKNVHSGILILSDIKNAANVRYVMPSQFWALVNVKL